RFGWVYDLIRGYAVGRDDRFVAAFARVLADWDANNPPFRGPGWACGQETSIRAIAIRYAEAAFAGAPGWSAETQQIVNRILWWSGERVNDGIGYALSQRNNHGLSEAVGLLALGDRFRSAVPVAADWFRRGRALAHRLVGEQFASDGWYIQHSFTYARLAADQAVIADRILRSAGEPGLDPAARQRLAAFGRLIAAVIDPASGEVPNHGASDGAFVHPITLGGYRDFRPILTAVTAITGERLRADVTADDEVLSWLGAAPPPRCPSPTVAVESGPSGWAVARGGPALVFVRAGQYRTRPGHVDPLQVDVRWEGRELIVDAGTYSYNGGRGWRNALSGAAVHNTPIVDDRPPGLKGPRFLWYRWPDARLGSVATDPPRITAEIPGRVRRTVTVTDAAVTIEDEVLSPRWRRARCVWLLHPDADPALVHGADRVVGATEDDPAGWFSPRYAVRIPSRYLLTERSGPGPFFQRIVIGQATGSEM
ncbi:MAG: heparinase II/III family protein, partial [Gemmatimonadales bacterium]